MEEKKYVYDFRIWQDLPSDLREKAVDIDNNKIDILKVEPTMLVCIETSTNPGSIPFVQLLEKNPFALFYKRASEKGLDLEKVKMHLSEL